MLLSLYFCCCKFLDPQHCFTGQIFASTELYCTVLTTPHHPYKYFLIYCWYPTYGLIFFISFLDIAYVSPTPAAAAAVAAAPTRNNESDSSAPATPSFLRDSPSPEPKKRGRPDRRSGELLQQQLSVNLSVEAPHSNSIRTKAKSPATSNIRPLDDEIRPSQQQQQRPVEDIVLKNSRPAVDSAVVFAQKTSQVVAPIDAAAESVNKSASASSISSLLDSPTLDTGAEEGSRGRKKRTQARVWLGDISEGALFDSIQVPTDSTMASQSSTQHSSGSASQHQNIATPSFMQDSVSEVGAKRFEGRKKLAKSHIPIDNNSAIAAFESIQVPSSTIASSPNSSQHSKGVLSQPQNIATPSFMEDSVAEEQVEGRRQQIRNRERFENNSAAGAFDSIQVPSNNTQVSPARSQQSKSILSQPQSITTPSFMEDSVAEERVEGRKQQIRSRVRLENNSAAAAFDSIQVPADNTVASQSNKQLSEGHASQPQNITTPSFMQDSVSKQGEERLEGRKMRTKSRRRVENNSAAAAFDSIQVPYSMAFSTPSSSQASQAVLSQSQNSATPSFLQDSVPEERAEGRRPQTKSRNRLDNTSSAAAFDSIQPPANNTVASQSSGGELSQQQNSASTSFPGDSTSEERLEGRQKQRRTKKSRGANLSDNSAMAAFDSILPPENSQSEQEPSGTDNGILAASMSTTLVSGPLTPSFLKDSPAQASLSRRARRSAQSVSSQELSVIAPDKSAAAPSAGDRSNTNLMVQPQINNSSSTLVEPDSTPFFMKDITPTTGGSGRRGVRKSQPTAAGTLAAELSVSYHETSGRATTSADKLTPPDEVSAIDGGANSSLLLPSPPEQRETVDKIQKFEETRALRASRKSEVLGYLVRWVVQ